MSKFEMEHEKDPRQVLSESVGSLDDIKLFNTQVLVAVYIRPEKTKSGIFLSDKSRDEDRYQSKVGLVLKVGKSAFVDPEAKWFDEGDVSVNDWVVFRPSEGWNITVNGVLCRILDDTAIRARITNPDHVW